MGVVLTVVLVVLTIVLQTYSCQNRSSHVLPQNRSSHIRTCFKGESSGVTDLLFLKMTKKRVEKGNPEEWCARHFYLVFTQFWNFAHTIVIHIFSIFVGRFQKNQFHYAQSVSHTFPYAIHFRSLETYAIHFRAPNSTVLRTHTPFISVLQAHTPFIFVLQIQTPSISVQHGYYPYPFLKLAHKHKDI